MPAALPETGPVGLIPRPTISSPPPAPAAGGTLSSAAPSPPFSISVSNAFSSSAAATAALSPTAPCTLPSALASSSSSSAAAHGAHDLKIRKATGQELALKYDADMTGIGLKRQLERMNEGGAGCLRLFFRGRELVDSVSLATQKLRDGDTLLLQLRDPPASTSTRSKATISSAATMYAVRKPGQWVGLRNQGATCYLNSLVQALFMTPSFRTAIHDLSAQAKALPAVPQSLVELFSSLQISPFPVSTTGFTDSLKWGAVSRQQDVHEFWMMLRERIELDLKGTSHAKLVESIFQGEQRDYVQCHTCGTTSYRTDCFQDLQLALGSEDSTRPPPTDVRAALRALLHPEQMCGTDRYQCDCCGRKTDAERGVQLTRLPSVLSLNLKRFRYDMRTGQRHKINSAFDFPTHINLAEFVAGTNADGTTEAVVAPPPSPLLNGSSAGGGGGSPMAPRAANEDDLPDRGPVGCGKTMHVDVVMEGSPVGAAAASGAPRDTPPLPTAADADGSIDGAVYSSMDAASPSNTDRTAGTASAASSLSYELYAVLVHQGSANFGHYYALIQDLGAGEWHEFNDSIVKSIKPSELKRVVGGEQSGGWVSSPTAYMLLYKQVGGDKGAQAPLGEASAAPAVTTGSRAAGADTAAAGGPSTTSGGALDNGYRVRGSGITYSPDASREGTAYESKRPRSPGAEQLDDDNPYTRMEGCM